MRVLVVGGGVAGIGAALALAGPGRSVKVIEHDPSPPNVSMNELFDIWERKGVTHLRHSHGFLARLFNLIRDRYPELMKTLFEAGAREVKFGDVLDPSVKQRYRLAPGDEDLSVLLCRRTTLEYVMRGYAEGLPDVKFVTSTAARGLLIEMESDGIHAAKGLLIEKPDGSQEELWADLVVDASGRNTSFPDWLAKYGIAPTIEEAPVGILYFTRHYRMLPGRTEPKTFAFGAEVDCVRCAVFQGDKGNFSVTLMVPETETILRQKVLHPEVFHRVCSAFPGPSQWIDPTRAAPVSKVFGMGNLKSHWRHWLNGGRPLIKNFFAIGDATIRSNPAFGRGCTFGFIHAHILADVLREADDPVIRAKLFDARSNAALRKHYDFMVKQDAASIKRSMQVQDPNCRPSFKDRLIKSFAENGVGPAIARDVWVRRAIMRGAHMLEMPNDWMKKPNVLARMLLMWGKPKRSKTEPGTELAPLPDRGSLLALARST